jgi:plasmid stability protein
MEKIEQHPTARLTSFVEPALAEALERQAAQNDRSVSAELRRILRQALEGKR